MYTFMEYTLYDTIYSDERTLQMNVHPPPPQKKKQNKQTNKNKQTKTSPVPTCKIT